MSVNKKSYIELAGFTAVMLYSFFTTGYGIYSQFSALDRMTALAFAFGLSAFLQFSMGLLWKEAGKSLSQRSISTLLRLPFYASLALIPTIGSTVFASSTNMYVYNRLAVKDYLDGQSRQDVLKPVVIVTDTAKRIASSFAAYSSYAATQSQREEKSGTSCENLKSAKECGPICRLRKKQASEAAIMSEIATSLQQDAIALQAASGGVIGQEAINAMYAKAAKLASDPRFTKITVYIDSEIQGFKSGFQLDDETLRICSDPFAVTKLNEMEKLVNAPIDIGNAPPTVQSPTFSSIAGRNTATLMDTVLRFWNGVPVGEDLLTADAKDHALMWALAFVVDFFCLIFAFRAGYSNNPNRGRVYPFVGDVLRGRMTKNAEGEVQIVLTNVKMLRVDLGPNSYLAIPADEGRGSLKPEMSKVQNFPAVLSQYGLKIRPVTHGGAIDVNQILPDQAQRLEAFTGTNHFRFWQIYGADKFEAKLARKLGVI